MRVTASALSVLAALSSSFPKGISAEEQDICNSFQGANAASYARAWCDTLSNKCCTDDDGNVSVDACGNWGTNAQYNLCEGSCRGTNSCLNMLANAAPDSSISIKKGACVSNSRKDPYTGHIYGVCEHFAEEVDGVVTASIGNNSCSGEEEVCFYFLADGSGDITVDIQDGACYGKQSCRSAFFRAGSGSSIVIKEKGCVGTETCKVASWVDGAVTASIGKAACSGGDFACKNILQYGSGDIIVDIQNEACYGEYACNDAFAYFGPGSSIVIKEKGCVGRRTCKRIAYDVEETKITASIGKGACSGGEDVCNGLVQSAYDIAMIDIHDGACSGGDQACYQVGRNARKLQSLTVPAEECSTENACYSCGYDNKSDGGLAITTACCNEDTTANVDDACLYSDAPSIVPSMSSQPSNLPSMSSQPSNLPSMSSQPSNLPSMSSQPSNLPSMSSQPSNLPSSEPSWKDDVQCKKVDPDNDICFKLGGRCKSDCEDDDNFVCVPKLCAYDKKWDKRALMEEELELVEMEVSAIGNTGRELQRGRKFKKVKAPKPSCACRVLRRDG